MKADLQFFEYLSEKKMLVTETEIYNLRLEKYS